MPDRFAGDENAASLEQLLDRINVVDANSVALLAQYDNTDEAWTKVH